MTATSEGERVPRADEGPFGSAQGGLLTKDEGSFAPTRFPRFAAGVVGSMPRPQFLRDLLDPRAEGTIPEHVYQKRLDAATQFVIAMQEAAGLDLISDGEWRRRSYIGVIAEVMHGFHSYVVDDELGTGRPFHTVVELMAPRRPGRIADEARFLVEHTDRLTKVCLPSPYLLGQRMWDPERSRKAYPTREAFMRALVPVLRRELEEVAKTGVTVAQFDDTHLCLFVDPAVRAKYDDPEREIDLAVGMLNDIVSGVGGVTIAVHLCRGNAGRLGWKGAGGYETLLPAMRRLDVQQYVLEYSIPVAGDMAVLRALPEDRLIGLGCVDVRGEQIDTVEQIVARAEEALRHVDAERLSLNPDCGFAPGSAAAIPIDEAYAKLQREAQAATILRERHSG
ncbi:MAG: cobalamin-independent methionine synthase II family protein [Chloroflexi bacterium]|nr:cobalamin-independent methionine synthase II family protein [Chloroflexota bacterium]